jgi:hypothetical protein
MIVVPVAFVLAMSVAILVLPRSATSVSSMPAGSSGIDSIETVSASSAAARSRLRHDHAAGTAWW